MLPVISAKQLKELSTEKLIILDVRTGKDSYQNYLNKHLKGARFVDLDKDLAEIVEDAAVWRKASASKYSKICRNCFSFGNFRRFSLSLFMMIKTEQMPQPELGGC
ncbi:hypothetical protein [Chryseobacterium indoltheticum]|uniref:hypothetical protein n=1 Tax=Chryseobacterium indoltheticum TaxID=254 RepID=UPI003F49A044